MNKNLFLNQTSDCFVHPISKRHPYKLGWWICPSVNFSKCRSSFGYELRTIICISTKLWSCVSTFKMHLYKTGQNKANKKPVKFRFALFFKYLNISDKSLHYKNVDLNAFSGHLKLGHLRQI